MKGDNILDRENDINKVQEHGTKQVFPLEPAVIPEPVTADGSLPWNTHCHT